jgi:hypothetical protein
MSTVMTGAKAIFRLNGVQVAYASSVDYNENIQLEEVNVLDKLEVQEHAEVGYRCEMSCRAFRVANSSVKQLGIMSKLGSILTQGELTAEIIDRTTNAVILLMEGVKLESRQTTIDARGVASETWSFKGRKASDEAGV